MSNKSRLLEVNDLMAQLSRSRRHVLDLIHRKTNPLPAFNQGGRTPYYCYQDDLDDWIDAIKTKSMEARKN